MKGMSLKVLGILLMLVLQASWGIAYSQPPGAWFTVFGGAEYEAVTGVSAMSPNNVFASGGTNSTTEPGDLSDGFIVMHDGNGGIAWGRLIDLSNIDFATRLQSSGGLVYVTGHTNSGSGTPDMNVFLAAFTPSGSTSWFYVYNNSPLYQDFAMDVYVDGVMYTYIVGYTVDPLTGLSDVLLLKVFSSNASVVWAIRIGEPLINETGFGVVADPTGIYIVGSTNTTGLTLGIPPNDINLLVMKVYHNGTIAWFRVLNLSIVDYGFKTVLDPHGYLYIVGEAREDLYGNDIVLGKFSASDGSLVYLKRIHYWRFDEGFDIAYYNNSIYIAGAGYPVYPLKSLYEIYALSLWDNGSLKWFAKIGGPDMDQGAAIDVYNGLVYLGGFTASWGAGAIDSFTMLLNTGYSEYGWCNPRLGVVNLELVGNATVYNATYDEPPYDPLVDGVPAMPILVDTGVRDWSPSLETTCMYPVVGGEAVIEDNWYSLPVTGILAAALVLLILARILRS